MRRDGYPPGHITSAWSNVCEELVRFTWLVSDNATILVYRYRERLERAGREAAAARSVAEARTG